MHKRVNCFKQFQNRLAPALVLAAGFLTASPAAAASAASVEEDAKTVAALDTQYQAAVKANDAEGMAKILADDFVLVTGRGKTYTKADLLDAAGTERVGIQQQRETEKEAR